MLFLVIITLSALGLAGAAIYFSVLGLVQTFSITALVWGSAIEASKLTTASFLTRYWHRASRLAKALGLFFVAALMMITSAGIYGHILSSYQESTIEVESQRIVMEEAQQDVDRLLATLTTLDESITITQNDITRANRDISEISARDDAFITARTRQADAVREDRDRLEERLTNLQTQRIEVASQHREAQREYLALRSEMLGVEAKVGPIITIISILGEDVGEKAMLWFILLIVLVFDPVAVYLTIQANKVAMYLKEDKQKKEKLEPIKEPSEPIPPSILSDDSTGEIKEQLSKIIEANTSTSEKISNMEKAMQKGEMKRDLRKSIMSD